MAYSKQRLREITDLKREAVRRIQTDIGEIHPSPRQKYIHEFSQEFDSFETVCDPDHIVDVAHAANLVWVGDYHALTKSQLYAVDLLRQIVEYKDNVALAVEPIFAKNQETLDRWMAGTISEQEFLERVRYEDEWGCDWTGYRALFEAARELRVPVYGVDCQPRNDMRRIGGRDLAVAHQITRIVQRNPDQTLIVV